MGSVTYAGPAYRVYATAEGEESMIAQFTGAGSLGRAIGMARRLARDTRNSVTEARVTDRLDRTFTREKSTGERDE